MRVAICGGSFDPIHLGHVEPVLAARGSFDWTEIIYVPAFRQPFKDRTNVSGLHRHAMTALAIADFDGFVTSTIELEREDVSYSVDTLRELRTRYPRETGIDWIIGDDNLGLLPAWRSIDEIFSMANFVVLSRGAHEVPDELRDRVSRVEGRPRNGTIVLAENRTVPISSTDIRERIEKRQPFEALVHPRVARYIHSHQLYRKGND